MPFQGLDTLNVVQIGIVVRDAKQNAEQFARILGLPMPGMFSYPPSDKPRGTYRGQPVSAGLLGAAFDLGRVQVEFLQALDTPNAWSDFLDQHGEGIHHVAFSSSDTAAAVASFAEEGYPVLQEGMFTDGSGRYTYFDTEKDLGIFIEVMELFGSRPAKADPPPFPADKGIGTVTATQVAVMTHDIERTARRWSEVLGVPMPPLILTPGYDVVKTTYHGAPSDATAKLAFFNVGQMQLELIEPDERASVWRDHLDAHGDSGHHIAFHVADTGRAVNYLLNEHGIAVTQQGYYGDLSGMYTYMGCEAMLGISVELLENFKK